MITTGGNAMYEFRVDKMTCGGCANRVANAVRAADSKASVDIDLRGKLVRVESALAPETVADAITKAGYAASMLSTDA
jgi:copper chaperone